MPKSFITQWETEAAKHIEARLNEAYINGNIRVKLWADAFSTNENPNKRMQVFLGHQKTEREKVAVTDAGTVYLRRYFVELRVEIFTLKSHQLALDLIEYILDYVLLDFRPFYEFSPFVIGESGGVTRNERSQSWVYQGSGFTELYGNIENLTPVFTGNPASNFIRIGIYNTADEQLPNPHNQIGIFIQTENNDL